MFHFKRYPENLKKELRILRREYRYLTKWMASKKSAQEKLKIYETAVTKPVVNLHINAGLWAVGKTELHKKFNQKIDDLKSTKTLDKKK